MEKRNVLFVDDDVIVLQSLETGLIDELYNKYFASSCNEALEIIQREKVHVLVTDMCMPDMDGLELLKIVKEKYPRIVKIIISGYTDMPVLHDKFRKKEIFKFVYKPWKVDRSIFEPWKLEIDLKKTVQEAFDHYDLQSQQEAVVQKN